MCSRFTANEPPAEACMASVSVDGRKACSDLIATQLRHVYGMNMASSLSLVQVEVRAARGL